MKKTRMENIAGMLGLKLMEVFTTNKYGFDAFRFSSNGLEVYSVRQKAWSCANGILTPILTNEVEIIKKPKLGDVFYTFDEDGSVVKATYGTNPLCFLAYRTGMYFKTYEEAEANRKKVPWVAAWE